MNLKPSSVKDQWGLVFAVREPMSEMRYALKIFDGVSSQVELVEMKREIVILSKLPQTPYIIKFIFCNHLAEEERLAIFMELADSNLEVLIKEGLSKEKANKYLRDICLGIQAIHSHKFIHGDIKPGNILIKDGVAKVCDFGVAKRLSESSVASKNQNLDESMVSLSDKSNPMGTLGYMPPEILRGQKYNQRRDI